MTGPEHYAEAERILAQKLPQTYTLEGTAQALAEAQVHATLALAAATDRGLARLRPATDGLASG